MNIRLAANFGGGPEHRAVSGQAGADRERDRKVALAGGGRVGIELLMLWMFCPSGSGWLGRRVGCVMSSLWTSPAAVDTVICRARAAC
jgi:hypothetical protein